MTNTISVDSNTLLIVAVVGAIGYVMSHPGTGNRGELVFASVILLAYVASTQKPAPIVPPKINPEQVQRTVQRKAQRIAKQATAVLSGNEEPTSNAPPSLLSFFKDEANDASKRGEGLRLTRSYGGHVATPTDVQWD